MEQRKHFDEALKMRFICSKEAVNRIPQVIKIKHKVIEKKHRRRILDAAVKKNNNILLKNR